MSTRGATLTGLLAVVLWSAVVGMIRTITENPGPTTGPAILYTLASGLLWLTLGVPRLRRFPPSYLIWGTLLATGCELCLICSIGAAHTERQAIEVGMVNYLWPTFTVVASILFNGKKATILIVPGVLLSLAGIFRLLAGESGTSLSAFAQNILNNPLSYGLSLTGAVLWALYSSLTTRAARGQNAVTVFFPLMACLLWGHVLVTGGAELQSVHLTLHTMLTLLLGAAALGFGYAAWNVGILYGNITVLAAASNLIPVFSALLAASMLHTVLPLAFWEGSLIVCAGSALCWLATRRQPMAPAQAELHPLSCTGVEE
ncbi:aromatic amino acid DMT transporter YddG [Acetobacter persici]|uniref:aromatic amino acid DMT transporter YddG n=1 Tax=Acetobacter persici TaxID=1076596 RepID=UPI001BA8984C|nr:aromatic amino acid DMT transporter YddG [Acetobacter persici]MBS0964452.1 aromatic amino acid DMT transporter YddG [Acetobacter persici]